MKKGLILIALPLFMIACGGSSGVGSLDKLPKMTNPVVTSGASSTALKINTAVAGLPFYGTNAASFTHGTSSRAMCETFNLSREIINRTAQADRILCYIQNTMVAPVNSAAFNSITPYDGNYHIVQLDFSTPTGPSGVTKPKMKFKIVKDGNNIKEFEMFMCMNGTDDALLQSEYMHQVINGETVNIVSKNIEGSDQWKGYIVVDGKLNSDSQFTEKTITALNYSNFSQSGYSGTNHSKGIFNQYIDSMIVNAYQTGSSSGPYGSNTYTNKLHSKFELKNGGNTDIQLLAMGDGSIYLQNTDSNGGNWDQRFSWTGDSPYNPLADPASGMYYSATSTATTLTDPTAEAAGIAFTASESWDCSGTAEVPMVVNQTELNAACDYLGIIPDGENSWIDCWNAVGNQ